jgi:hypothetical protein
MSDEDSRLVIPCNARRAAGGFAASSALFAGSAFLALVDRTALAVMAAAFCAYFTVEWTLALLRRPALELNSEGFRVRTAFLTRSYHWRDVKRFGVFGGGIWQLVGLEFDSGRVRCGPLRRLSRALSGFDSGLPNVFVLAPTQLADLLSQWRARFGSEPGDLRDT